MNATLHTELPQPGAEGRLVRLVTCGSVDDGKSTLIGRLLHDTGAILDDTLAELERVSRERGRAAVDLSYLTDGLSAEREQGITIDVAYRRFASRRRAFLLADAPGHEQYTRNMVTAASTADVAVLLVDVRNGIVRQTRRHALVARMVGVPTVIVAVNKMDLVGYAADAFERVASSARRILGPTTHVVPVSSLRGDMVVERGSNLPWYEGPSLLDLLESAPPRPMPTEAALRFPVQFVCRPADPDRPELHDYRGLMGQVERGSLQVGQDVLVEPAGLRSKVLGLDVGGTPVDSVASGAFVSVRLEDDLDVSRGDVLVSAQDRPSVTPEFEADVCWLGERPLDLRGRYRVRVATQGARARIVAVVHRTDLENETDVPADGLHVNEIGRIRFHCARPFAIDPFDACRAMGAVLVLDDADGTPVATGVIRPPVSLEA